MLAYAVAYITYFLRYLRCSVDFGVTLGNRCDVYEERRIFALHRARRDVSQVLSCLCWNRRCAICEMTQYFLDRALWSKKWQIVLLENLKNVLQNEVLWGRSQQWNWKYIQMPQPAMKLKIYPNAAASNETENMSKCRSQQWNWKYIQMLQPAMKLKIYPNAAASNETENISKCRSQQWNWKYIQMPQPAMNLKIYPNSGNNCNSRMKCLKKTISALASKIDVVPYKIFDHTCQVEVYPSCNCNGTISDQI